MTLGLDLCLRLCLVSRQLLQLALLHPPRQIHSLAHPLLGLLLGPHHQRFVLELRSSAGTLQTRSEDALALLLVLVFVLVLVLDFV